MAAAARACCWLAAARTKPAEDPVQVKLNDLDARLGGVERVVSNQSLVDMSQRIDELEAQLRELRGGVEELQNSERHAAQAAARPVRRSRQAPLARSKATRARCRARRAPAAGAGRRRGAGTAGGAGTGADRRGR